MDGILIALRHLIGSVLWKTAGVFLLWSFTSLAYAQSCVFSSVAVDNPGTIKVPATALAANEVLAIIKVTYTFSCTAPANTSITMGAPATNGDGFITIPSATNVAWQGSAYAGFPSPPRAPGRGGFDTLSGSACVAANATGSSRATLNFVAAGTCTGQAFHYISILSRSAGAVSGNLPINLPAGAGFTAGWVSASSCTYTSCPNPVGQLARSGISATIALLPMTNTCTLSSAASMVVNLPTVALSAFGAVGSTAGVTGFSIGVNCPTAGVAGLSVTLMYGTSFTASVAMAAPSYLINLAASPAPGINAVILDSSGVAVSSGVSRSVTSSVSAGYNGITFYAAYQRTAAAIGTGNVQGVATYVFTYQ